MSYYIPSNNFSKKQSTDALEFEEEEKAKLYRKAINAKVLEAYRSNHALLEYLPTANEECARVFWEQVDQAKKPVKRQIMKLIRLRRGSKEYIYYHQELTSTNKKGVPIHLYETCLKYEMPNFIPTYNPSSGEETGSEIGTTDTIYECEYPEKWDKKVEDFIIDTVDLVCIADNGRHFGGYNLSDFLSWNFQDLLTWGRFGTLTPNIQDIQAKELQRKLAKIK